MSQQRVAFKVHGTVQGVNFRSFTQSRATSHHVTGWVSNTSDGKVSGEAQGTKDSLDGFLRELGDGPGHAQVVKLEKEQMDVKESDSGFDVK